MVKTCITDGIEMKYIEFGKGTKPFVILPGLSLKPVTDEYRSVVAAYFLISSGYKVYLFDRRENIPQKYTIEDMGKDTAAVMKKLGISGASLFGVSQGGMIAMYIAADYPELVSELIIGSSAFKHTVASEEIISEWIKLAKEHMSRELTDSFLENVYSTRVCKMMREVMVGDRAVYSTKEFERFEILANAARNFDLSSFLGRIKCRTFVLASEGDRIFGCSQANEIADRLGCRRYIYGKEFGHAVYDEAPDYLLKIKEFLDMDGRP